MQFVTEDIDSYVSRKRNNHVHGNHIEIQAISEIFNRPVEIYAYHTGKFDLKKKKKTFDVDLTTTSEPHSIPFNDYSSVQSL